MGFAVTTYSPTGWPPRSRIYKSEPSRLGGKSSGATAQLQRHGISNALAGGSACVRYSQISIDQSRLKRPVGDLFDSQRHLAATAGLGLLPISRHAGRARGATLRRTVALPIPVASVRTPLARWRRARVTSRKPTEEGHATGAAWRRSPRHDGRDCCPGLGNECPGIEPGTRQLRRQTRRIGKTEQLRES